MTKLKENDTEIEAILDRIKTDEVLNINTLHFLELRILLLCVNCNGHNYVHIDS